LRRKTDRTDNPAVPSCRLAVALGVAVLAAGRAVPAEISTDAIPVFHGFLRLARGGGSFDPATGSATVRVRGWRFELAPFSNGIYPDREPIVLAIGTENFRLEAGTLRASRRGTRFSYRSRGRGSARGIRALEIRRLPAGTYVAAFTLRDVPLYQLTENAPVCLPTALIVGDDDGFSGVSFDNPGFPRRPSRRVTVAAVPCVADAWPWT
jgi:hypothetical protein